MYPYCPPHIARPKETKRLLLIALPERCYLAVRRWQLVAAGWWWGGGAVLWALQAAGGRAAVS